MILVLGANGMLGRQVADMLLTDGHRVRAAGRRPSDLAAMEERGAEVVALDLDNPDAIASALAGVDTVFVAVHGLMGSARDSVERVDVKGQKRLIDAARAAGVQRFVMTSAQNADAASATAFLRAKGAAEQHLEASGLDYTILRPSAFADLYAHKLIGEPVLAGKTVWLLGSGQTRRNLVAVADVARIAVRALTEGAFSRQTIPVGGPDNLTEREVAALYGRLSGRGVKSRSVPVGIVRLLAGLMAPFTGKHNLLRFLASSEGRSDLSFEAAGMAQMLGREPIALEDAARAHVAEARGKPER